MKFTTKIATTFLSVLTLSAQPALAVDENSNLVAVQKQAAREKAKVNSTTKEYCANVRLDTGSRVGKKVCRTKSEWAAQGVELKN